MMRTFVCVFLAVITVGIKHVESVCPEFSVCTPPVPMGDKTYCDGVLSYITCLKDKLSDNPECSNDVKVAVNSQVEKERNNMKQVPACADYVCPITSCAPPMGSGGDMCSDMTDWIICLKEGVANDKCDVFNIEGAQATIAMGNEQLKSLGCPELPDCSFLVCDTFPNQADDEYCSKGKELISCLTEKVVNNAKCDDFSKTAAQEVTTNAEKNLKDQGCDAAVGLVSSIAMCLLLSWIAYFLSK